MPTNEHEPDAVAAGIAPLDSTGDVDSASASALNEGLTNELLALVAGLQELLTLQSDPTRVGLDAERMQDLRVVVGRLHNALLGSGQGVEPGPESQQQQ